MNPYGFLYSQIFGRAESIAIYCKIYKYLTRKDIKNIEYQYTNVTLILATIKTA